MPQVPLLERLGLHRPELRAWAMYDWANSAFWATVVLIFPIYFIKVASADEPVAVTPMARNVPSIFFLMPAKSAIAPSTGEIRATIVIAMVVAVA